MAAAVKVPKPLRMSQLQPNNRNPFPIAASLPTCFHRPEESSVRCVYEQQLSKQFPEGGANAGDERMGLTRQMVVVADGSRSIHHLCVRKRRRFQEALMAATGTSNAGGDPRETRSHPEVPSGGPQLRWSAGTAP